jgi:hypothetical protein
MGRQTGSGASFAVRRRWGAVSVRGRSLSAGTRWVVLVGGGLLRLWVGVTLGVVLLSGGLLCPWALAFGGGRRVGSCSRRWGLVASEGARVRGWGSFSSVGGCCFCGRSRSRVGVAFGVLLVGGVLLWGGFVVVGAFRVPAAGVVRGRSSFVGGGRSSGVDDGGGVVLACSGCDVALPRRCRPSLRRPVLSGSFWFSLTVVASRRRSALILVGDVALACRVAASSSTVVADVLGCAVVVVVVGGRRALWAVAWWCGGGRRRWGGERWGCWRLRLGIDVDIGEGSDLRLWPAGFVCGGGGYGSSSNEIA